jgi:hypothetical protein
MKPVVAIYSTFLQRGYDQLVHDVALQNLPVLFAIDRAGVVGADGATHIGAFDVSFLRCLPNIIVTRLTRTNAAGDAYTGLVDRPVAVRYPRGSGPGAPVAVSMTGCRSAARNASGAYWRHHWIIFAFGSMLQPALAAEKRRRDCRQHALRQAARHQPMTLLASQHSAFVTVEATSPAERQCAVSEALAAGATMPRCISTARPVSITAILPSSCTNVVSTRRIVDVIVVVLARRSQRGRQARCVVPHRACASVPRRQRGCAGRRLPRPARVRKRIIAEGVSGYLRGLQSERFDCSPLSVHAPVQRQCAAQHAVPEHLRRLRAPQALARFRPHDAPLVIDALQRVGHGQREEPADVVDCELALQPQRRIRIDARPYCVMNDNPVVGVDVGHPRQRVVHRCATRCAAAA